MVVMFAFLAPCWAEETPQDLQQKCDGGTMEACYQLALRYRDGREVTKDAARSSALLLQACEGRFGQACFTACLSEISVSYTCSMSGNSGPEPWQSLRAFLAAPDTERRRQMLSASRSLSFLWSTIDVYAYEEIASLPDWVSLRHAAQARLTEIAKSDPDPSKRAASIRHIYDAIPIDVLKEIAQKDPDPQVRKTAKERLAGELRPRGSGEDAAEVVRMAKSPDVETRLAAVQKLIDPALLAKLAEKDPDRQVREVAVDRLADHADVSQAVLGRIAEKDKDERVRASAAALITDQKVLERLLRTSRVTSVRRHALENLEDKPIDPSLLAWVAENDSDHDLRQEATGRLTDQVVLARLAKSSPSEEVRAAATSKIEDQKLLGEIAIRDLNDWVYKAAITAIKDDAVLADIIRRRPEEDVLEFVARKTTNQSLLGDIVKTAKESIPRGVATGKLTDTALLRRLVNDPDPVVSNEATKRLKALSPTRPLQP